MINTTNLIRPILIAEDDPEDRMLTVDALQESQICKPYLFVEDGEDLIHYLKHEGKYEDAIAHPTPGIIILDLNMPRKDGREALVEIKSDPILRSIPIIILTTSRSEEDIRKSYDLGVNSYISKPNDFRGLVEIMNSISTYWFDIVTLPKDQKS